MAKTHGVKLMANFVLREESFLHKELRAIDGIIKVEILFFFFFFLYIKIVEILIPIFRAVDTEGQGVISSWAKFFFRYKLENTKCLLVNNM